MALSILTQTVFEEPYGIDETARRIWLRGKLVFSGSSGTYQALGLLPNLGVATANVLAPLQTTLSAQDVLFGQLTQGSIGLITAVTSASSGATTTIYTSNTPLANQFVTFNGLTTATALNGLTLQVVSVSAGVSFVVASSVPTQSKTADTGTAVTVIGPDDMEIHSVAGSGYIYQYNKSLATVQVFEVPDATSLSTPLPLAELAASTTPSGVTGDVIHFVASWAKQ